MSSKAKGRRTLNKAKDWYEKQGWLVDEVELGGKFRKSRDLFSSDSFGGFDLVGIKRGKTVLIQVKTNTPPTQGPYQKFAKKYAGRNLVIEAWTWYDSKGPVIHKFSSSGKVLREDYRK